MSYSIRIEVTDGTATLAEQQGSVPDGTLTVAGHSDTHHETLSVARAVAGGRQPLSASVITPPLPAST
jgi:hypothetical protein